MISKPNSIPRPPPAHHQHTTSHHHHHHHPPYPPPATCRQAKGGGSCFLPIESPVFGPFFGNPRSVKKVRKNTYVLTPHFLMEKLEQVVTKLTEIGHFVRVFGEFKIVEFAMPWDPDVICRGRRYSCKSLLFFDA